MGWCCNTILPTFVRTVVRIVSQRCSIVVSNLADRTNSRSTLPTMIETTTLTPPDAHCTIARAHDPGDSTTAYEITVDGVTIELDTTQARQLARVLTAETSVN